MDWQLRDAISRFYADPYKPESTHGSEGVRRTPDATTITNPLINLLALVNVIPIHPKPSWGIRSRQIKFVEFVNFVARRAIRIGESKVVVNS